MGGYAYTKYNAQKPERQSSDQESEEEETVPVNVNAFSGMISLNSTGHQSQIVTTRHFKEANSRGKPKILREI